MPGCPVSVFLSWVNRCPQQLHGWMSVGRKLWMRDLNTEFKYLRNCITGEGERRRFITWKKYSFLLSNKMSRAFRYCYYNHYSFISQCSPHSLYSLYDTTEEEKWIAKLFIYLFLVSLPQQHSSPKTFVCLHSQMLFVLLHIMETEWNRVRQRTFTYYQI